MHYIATQYFVSSTLLHIRRQSLLWLRGNGSRGKIEWFLQGLQKGGPRLLECSAAGLDMDCRF
jgi:hypothetical protein